MAEDSALRDLEALRKTSLDSVSLDGSWVALLSAKSVGIKDPLQVAANGTHRFLAADILAQHVALRSDGRFSGATIRLLKSTDFGKRSTRDGKPFWVTFAQGFFPDAESVRDFCAQAYPEKSGAALENLCVPQRLSAPH